MKFCGLRTPREVEQAVAAGATAVGFVLSTSSRQVSVHVASQLVRSVPDDVAALVVFDWRHVTASVAEIASIGATSVQVHSPTAVCVAAFRGLGVDIVPAVGPAHPGVEVGTDELILVDSPIPGSGTVWNWSGRLPSPARPWILAGGLTPRNVATAVARTRPWGVDVSSGIEERPGAGKSAALMDEFASAVAAIPDSHWGCATT